MPIVSCMAFVYFLLNTSRKYASQWLSIMAFITLNIACITSNCHQNLSKRTNALFSCFIEILTVASNVRTTVSYESMTKCVIFVSYTKYMLLAISANAFLLCCGCPCFLQAMSSKEYIPLNQTKVVIFQCCSC